MSSRISDMGALADRESLGALLACLIHELPARRGVKGWHIPLRHGEIEARVSGWSQTGRSLPTGCILHRASQSILLSDDSALQLLLEVLDEHVSVRGKALARQVRFSRERMFGLIAQRERQAEDGPGFLTAEQAPILGDGASIAPKLLSGMSLPEERTMTADWQGALRLTALDVAEEMVTTTAPDLAARLPGFNLATLPGRAILPVHPLAWDRARRDPAVKALIQSGAIRDLGPVGPGWWVTANAATLWRHDAPFQITAQLPVRDAHGSLDLAPEEMRARQMLARRPELRAGRFGPMRLIGDRHRIALKVPGQLDALNLILRDNPWHAPQGGLAMQVAGLVAEPLPGRASLLSQMTCMHTAEDWFTAYLACALDPILRLYDATGFAILAEARHAVLDLTHALPSHCDIRDAQVLILDQAADDELRAFPGLICDPAGIQDNLTASLLTGQAFAIIHRMARDHLLPEARSFALLFAHLDALSTKLSGHAAPLLRRWLQGQTLPIRRRLPCRDEARAFVDLPNPLTQPIRTLAAVA